VLKKLPLLLLTINLFASPITIEFIDSLPYSNAKDYYIWRFLDQKVTPTEAMRAFYQTKRMNTKILYRYAKRGDDTLLNQDVKCMQTAVDRIGLLKEVDCKVLAMSPYKATKMDSSKLIDLSNEIKEFYPFESTLYNIIASPSPFSRLLLEDERLFLEIINSAGSDYRQQHLNVKLPKPFIERLIEHPEFNRAIKLITTDPKMRVISESLMGLDASTLTHHSTFFLALNALSFGDKDMALSYLDLAQSKAWDQMDRDKVTFWKYQITQDRQYLHELGESWALNFYVIYADLKTKKPFKNVYRDIKVSHEPTTYSVNNPFEWLQALDEAEELDYKQMEAFRERFTEDEHKAHLAFFDARYSKYRKHYFLRPFKPLLANRSIHRQSLLHALGRQESRFIPSSISTSYAMGAMQIMPFLSRHLSKEMKEPLKDLDDMLKLNRNVRFADHHLDFLEHRLKNPLFVAYAYNGGIGFTRRYLQSGKFIPSEPYEPFMSMEMMANDESREYGKKVLANYIIYRYIEASPVDLDKLLQQIISPYQEF
jgi:soluble lytic murein transglycosylase